MKKVFSGFCTFVKDENGLTTAEWVILASAVSIAAMSILAILIPKIKSMSNNFGSQLDDYDPSNPE